MKLAKQIFSRWYIYIIWGLLSFFIWGWIFGMVTDTSTYHKVSIYIDCASCEDLELTLALEEDMPEGIKMVKVHPLSYVVFDETTMFMGDILILRESNLENYVESLCPITELAQQWQVSDTYSWEGEVYGIRVYDGATGTGILEEQVTFLYPGEAAEDFYLVFLAESHHLGELNGSQDDAAVFMAQRLMTME